MGQSQCCAQQSETKIQKLGQESAFNQVDPLHIVEDGKTRELCAEVVSTPSVVSARSVQATRERRTIHATRQRRGSCRGLPVDRVSELIETCWRQVFDHFDKDHEGGIDAKEFLSVLKALSCDVSMDDVEKLVEKLDTDQSGSIDPDEFVKFASADHFRTLRHDDLEALFSAFDPDMSGYITAAELRQMMTVFGEALTDDHIDLLMNEYDEDGSGQIDSHEFKMMVMDLGFKFTSMEESEEAELVHSKSFRALERDRPQQVSHDDAPEPMIVDISTLNMSELLHSVTDAHGKVNISDVVNALEAWKVKQTGSTVKRYEPLHWDPALERRGLGQVIRKVNHIAIIVSDIGRSAHFYSEVLGLQQIRRPDFDRHGAWFTMGNLELHLIKGVPIVHSGADLIVGHIAIEVEDVDRVPEILTKLEVPFRQNVSVPKGVRSKGTGTNDANDSACIVKQFFFRDPDGYYIEVCNCEVLTDYCLGKKNDLPGYSQDAPQVGLEGAITCTTIGVMLANYCKEQVNMCNDASLQGKPASEIAEWLHCQPADIVDEDKVKRLLVRHTVYGDICQNESPEDLKEILRLSGNSVPLAIKIITLRAGNERLYRPPAFFEMGRKSGKYQPPAVKVQKSMS